LSWALVIGTRLTDRNRPDPGHRAFND
jgi:hypothetical protein